MQNIIPRVLNPLLLSRQTCIWQRFHCFAQSKYGLALCQQRPHGVLICIPNQLCILYVCPQLMYGLALSEQQPRAAWLTACLAQLRTHVSNFEPLQDGHCLWALATWRAKVETEDMQAFLQVICFLMVC